MRCDYCGYDPAHHENPSTVCAPPFERRSHAFNGKHPSHARPLDTSQLGRICIDPNDDRIRADMVREAMERVARELWDSDASNGAAVVVRALRDIIAYGKDDTLTKLYRMLNP